MTEKSDHIVSGHAPLLALWRSPWVFDLLLFLLFSALAGFGAFHHELWRDEMQAWLIARDMDGPLAIIRHCRYEGHPPLWYLLLWPLTLLTSNPAAMQVLTWLLAITTFGLLVIYGPFTRTQKLLLTVNYYLLFQYGVVCRNYLPGILALFLACVFSLGSRPRMKLAAACLGLASLASVHTLILAVAMAIGLWLVPWLSSRLHRLRSHPGFTFWREHAPSTRALIAAGAILAAGILLSVAAMIPAEDTYYYPAHIWMLHWNAERIVRIGMAIAASHITLPRPPFYFWLPPWDVGLSATLSALGAIGWLGCASLFVRSHRALLTYLVGSGGLLLFFYVKYLGAYRHTGLLFIAFLLCFWIYKKDATLPAAPRFRYRDTILGTVLTVLLLAQAVTGLHALHKDILRPFSGSKNTARIIREHDLQDAFIAVAPDWKGAPLSGYLQRELFYPHVNRIGSFTKWDRERLDEMTDDEVLHVTAKATAGIRPVVLVLRHRLDADLAARHHIEFLDAAIDTLTPEEDYFIHLAPDGLGVPASP